MATNQTFLTVDADGHVLEPRDTWQKYLEPKYRADAIRIEKDGRWVLTGKVPTADLLDVAGVLALDGGSIVFNKVTDAAAPRHGQRP